MADSCNVAGAGLFKDHDAAELLVAPDPPGAVQGVARTLYLYFDKTGEVFRRELVENEMLEALGPGVDDRPGVLGEGFANVDDRDGGAYSGLGSPF